MQLLTEIAELRAELARRPVAMHQARLAGLREDIESLSTARAALRKSVDDISSSSMAMRSAGYLSARAEDLRQSQANHYGLLARAEADLAVLKETAARAQARADVLACLSDPKRKRSPNR